MKIAIGIETIARPGIGRAYLDQTWANLRRAGVTTSKHLATKPDQPIGIVTVYGEGYTRQQNGMRAIKEALRVADEYGADWVMKLEDDLDFTDNFLENVADWLADYGHADTCMFSLAATFERVSMSRLADGVSSVFEAQARGDMTFPTVREYLRRGETCVPHRVGGYWGAQALVFRREDARDLVKFLGDDPALFDGKEYHRNRGHDLILQTWAHARKTKVFACAVPSFVQHIGEHSNLDQPEINHKQPFFQFPFAGRDYRYQRRAA